MSPGQFSLRKLFVNNLNESLSDQISEEIQKEILSILHEEAEAARLSCEGETNENLKTICKMCQVIIRQVPSSLKLFRLIRHICYHMKIGLL